MLMTCPAATCPSGQIQLEQEAFIQLCLQLNANLTNDMQNSCHWRSNLLHVGKLLANRPFVTQVILKGKFSSSGSQWNHIELHDFFNWLGDDSMTR